ncbi:MAG: hypothetical protein NVS3B10_24230 [Polyangiales bacterium]
MTRPRSILFASLLALGAPGCSSASFDVAPSPGDRPGDDAAAGDARSDSTASEAGVDSGATGVDSQLADVPATDGPIGEGGTVDAVGGDATGADAVGVDAIGPDGAPLCPAPPSSGTFDASALDCDVLTDEYVKAFTDSTTCGCAEDCSQLECVDLCCTCYGWVSRASPSYPKLEAIKAEFEARVAAGRCSRPTTCASCPVAKPPPAGCHGSGPGTPQTCR